MDSIYNLLFHKPLWASRASTSFTITIRPDIKFSTSWWVCAFLTRTYFIYWAQHLGILILVSSTSVFRILITLSRTFEGKAPRLNSTSVFLLFILILDKIHPPNQEPCNSWISMQIEYSELVLDVFFFVHLSF